jgi:hypothetical protein
VQPEFWGENTELQLCVSLFQIAQGNLRKSKCESGHRVALIMEGPLSTFMFIYISKHHFYSSLNFHHWKLFSNFYVLWTFKMLQILWWIISTIAGVIKSPKPNFSCIMSFSTIWCCMAVVRPNATEERIASVIRVKEFCELGTALVVTSYWAAVKTLTFPKL